MEIKEVPMPDKFPDTPNLSNYSDTLYRVISQKERELKKCCGWAYKSERITGKKVKGVCSECDGEEALHKSVNKTV